ncbi:hypothetical protein Emtol_1259 [Emticicia oligotrophica DSM 17448]|uniref:Uncharacterized protein n=1 Tax=Emticicia oligotrophica (strain DSM 17448 / CIP 109782 / MTCC 6937 / GPTSA100-15) TaxID=929562 RepID=A0ABM5MZG3_EMTOG|nr:hypothetical protein [Emticicia oligotrophica]AFK02408.1 hypothetical protein Emtol_1259 [Emticicia oligotrophica DSM 17448]
MEKNLANNTEQSNEQTSKKQWIEPAMESLEITNNTLFGADKGEFAS